MIAKFFHNGINFEVEGTPAEINYFLTHIAPDVDDKRKPTLLPSPLETLIDKEELIDEHRRGGRSERTFGKKSW